MTIYTADVGYIEGILLAQNTSIKVSLETPDEDVATIPLGWDGESPGPRKVVITFENASPASGDDFDAWEAALNATYVEVMVQQTGTGKTLKTSGYLRSPSRDSGVGKAVNQNFEFHGKPAKWE